MLMLSSEQRVYDAEIARSTSQIVSFKAKIWIRKLEGPGLFPVLACRHTCASLERPFEGAVRSKSHLVCNNGNRVFTSFQMPFGVSYSQGRKPTTKADTNFIAKIGAKISTFQIDDTSCPLQADFLTIVFFAEVREAP
jgi:hypothetical protein